MTCSRTCANPDKIDFLRPTDADGYCYQASRRAAWNWLKTGYRNDVTPTLAEADPSDIISLNLMPGAVLT
jgi:hypothetical protein